MLKIQQYDFSTAVSYCNKVLEIDSNNIEALGNLQSCKLYLNDLYEIDLIAEKLLSLKDTVASLFSKARKEELLNNIDKANSIYLKIYSIDNYNEYSLRKLGYYYVGKSNFNKALFFWKKYEQRYVLNEEDNISIGVCYAKQKRYNNAINYFKKALLQNSTNC